ncbi:MAG: glutamyl-tRNA reductase [Alphaproteobacteria bacterium]
MNTARPQTAGRPLVVGANHRTSSMLLRDRLFVEDHAMPGILDALAAVGLNEALVMSTCDRVEVQAVVAADVDETAIVEGIIGVLAAHGETPTDELEDQTYRHWDADAVRQIFAVSASLDSLVIGEPQVLGQVKASHRMAKQAGRVGSDLESLLQAAYATAKRVRNETDIGKRPVSIAAAATRLAGDLHGNLADCSALLIGGGEMGELIATDMLAAGLGHLLVVHPNAGRSDELAGRLGCHTDDFEKLGELLNSADVVLASLGRRSRCVGEDMVDAAISRRRHKPIFLIDTAIPGDIEPSVERIDDAFLYDLGDLERVAMEGRAGRRSEAAAAWKIVDEDIAEFLGGRAEREAVPTLNKLRAHVETLRLQALADAGGDAEKATRLLVSRLLHDPSETLRGAARAQSEDHQSMEKIIDRLFGLSDKEF